MNDEQQEKEIKELSKKNTKENLKKLCEGEKVEFSKKDNKFQLSKKIYLEGKRKRESAITESRNDFESLAPPSKKRKTENSFEEIEIVEHNQHNDFISIQNVKIKLPIFVLIFDKKLNIPFAVSHIASQEKTGEGEYFLSDTSQIFKSQFEKVFKDDEDYSYSFFFQNYNEDKIVQGSWNPEEMIPLTSNLIHFKCLFEKNGMLDLFNRIQLFLDSRDDLTSMTDTTFSVPKLKNEGVWI